MWHHTITVNLLMSSKSIDNRYYFY